MATVISPETEGGSGHGGYHRDGGNYGGGSGRREGGGGYSCGGGGELVMIPADPKGVRDVDCLVTGER